MLTVLPPMLLLLISVFASFLYDTTLNYFSKKCSASGTDIYAFSVVSSSVATVLLLLLSDDLHLSLPTVLMSLLFGALIFSCNISAVNAFQRGPMSLTKVLITSSTLIAALSGFFFWDESISPAAGVGMVLMMLMVVLTAKRDDSDRKASRVWILLCVLAIFSSGFVGVTQKLHQTSAYRNELDGFLLVSFLLSTLTNLWQYLRSRRKVAVSVTFSPRQATFWLSLLCGVGMAFPHKINLYLSGILDSAIFFPLVNSIPLLLSLLAAIIFFRERPNLRQYIGILLGFAAVLLLSGIV